MNYTDWIRTNIPDMAKVPNEETVALLNDARQLCNTYIVIMKIVCILVALIIADIIGGYFSISIFTSANGFILAVVAIIIGEVVSQKFITAKMKKTILQLAQDNE